MDKRLISVDVKALLGSSAVALAIATAASPVLSQSRDVQTVQAPAQRTFNIPPQPLASALPLFGHSRAARSPPTARSCAVWRRKAFRAR